MTTPEPEKVAETVRGLVALITAIESNDEKLMLAAPDALDSRVQARQ